MSTPPKKPDFSNVQSKVTSTEAPKADFSNVQSTVTSTEPVIEGGAGGGEPVRTYTVEKGDSLSKIAKEQLGNANAWKQIFEANRDVLDDPDRIFPGQVIKLPAQAPGA